MGSRIPKETIDRVRDAVNIVELVGQSVELKAKGSAYMGLCPFHDDTSASLRVEPGRQRWRCWSCDKAGDPFDWLVEKEGLSFPDAVRQLAGEVGVEVAAAAPEVPLEPGAVSVGDEWAMLATKSASRRLVQWLISRGVHPETAQAAGGVEGALFVPDGETGQGLGRLMFHMRVGIALLDGKGRVRDVERRSNLPPAELAKRHRAKSQRLKPADRGEVRGALYFGDTSRLRQVVAKGWPVYIVEGGPDWLVMRCLLAVRGVDEALVLGAGCHDLRTLGRDVRRIISSLSWDQPPPVFHLVPDLGDGDRQGERAMLEFAAMLSGVALCRWCAPVVEHQPAWRPRLAYRRRRWRPQPGPGRPAVKADLGDLAELPPAKVWDVLDNGAIVMDEGSGRTADDDGEADPWRPARFDRLRRFLPGLPLATVADALCWRYGPKGRLQKYGAAETDWWLGDLAVQWFKGRGARFGQDEDGLALVYWPHTLPHEGRLFPLKSRRWGKVLYVEGRISTRAISGQNVLQAMDSECLNSRPMIIRPWSFASAGEVRLHLHDDLDRVAVARAGEVHVEPNAAGELHSTSTKHVRPIGWAPGELGEAVALLYDRVARWITTDPIDRVACMAWVVMSLARYLVTLRPILVFKGPAGIGKSGAGKLLATLIHGFKRVLARPTWKSLYAAGNHPITVLDNVEERNRKAVEDWLLIAATGGQRTIGTKEGDTRAQEVDTFALLTSIVVSGRYELMTRMFVVESGREWVSEDFSEAEVVDAIAEDRPRMLHGMLGLWAHWVLPRWAEVQPLSARIDEDHIAWRQRETLAAMAIIGAGLGRLDGRFTDLTAEQLLDEWLRRQADRVGFAAVETDPILFGLEALLRAWNRVSWGPTGKYWQSWLDEEGPACQPLFLGQDGASAVEDPLQGRWRKRYDQRFPIVVGFVGTPQQVHTDIVRALKAGGQLDQFRGEIPDGRAMSARWDHAAKLGWGREFSGRPRGVDGSRQRCYRWWMLSSDPEPDAGPPEPLPEVPDMGWGNPPGWAKP